MRHVGLKGSSMPILNQWDRFTRLNPLSAGVDFRHLKEYNIYNSRRPITQMKWEQF